MKKTIDALVIYCGICWTFWLFAYSITILQQDWMIGTFFFIVGLSVGINAIVVCHFNDKK